MTRKQQQRISEVVALLDEQREKLKGIHKQFYSAYDAAFDEHGAGASVQRWFDRTVKLIKDHVSDVEATKWHRALSTAPRGRGSWHWGELCQYFDTYLIRLIEDIEENPDDPSFDSIAPAALATINNPASDVTRCDFFLSYSTQDDDEARPIHAALAKMGKKCFLAEKHLKPGDKFRDEILNALKCSNEIWILVSPNSIRSEWVLREASAAWALEKRVVPILFRCSPGELPDTLADLQAIDYHKVNEHIARLR